MKNLSISFRSRPNRATSKRGGFTMIEILVAVGLTALLLAIILVPLRLALETYHIGTARSGLQQELQLTMQQFDKDLRRASFIFPNTRVPGISDSTDLVSSCALQPYQGETPVTPGTKAWQFLPYFRKDVAPSAGVTTNPANLAASIGITNPSNQLKPFSNPSRIDMLFLRRPNGNGIAAKTGEDYVVSYYPRRLNIELPYDVIENPIVLFRAQYPYRRRETTGFQTQPAQAPAPIPVSALNAQTDWTQYPSLGSSTPNLKTNRDYLWITHNYYGEANLEPLCVDVDATTSVSAASILDDVIASHTLATPRGMQLPAPAANKGEANAFVPELSFVQSSSDNKRIDRVTVNITLAQYDQVGAAVVNGQGKAQRVNFSRTFDLPNAGCTN